MFTSCLPGASSGVPLVARWRCTCGSQLVAGWRRVVPNWSPGGAMWLAVLRQVAPCGSQSCDSPVGRRVVRSWSPGGAVCCQLQTLMKENGDVPDIERLEHGEFELDTAEQTRLQALGDAQVQQVGVHRTTTTDRD